MKGKFLKSVVVTSVVAMALLCAPLSSYATEVDVNSVTTVAEESVVVDYPEITGFSNTATGTKVSWTAYDGASKYRLYYWNGSTWKGIGTTANLNLTHNGLTNETTYFYTVRAMDSNGKNISDYNHEGYANTYLASPVISSISNTANGVEIKWNKSDFADSYRVYRKTKNSGWSYIGDSDSASYTDKNATSGTAYTYTIRCLDKNGKLISSYNNGKSITYVQAPKISKIENTATGSKISWSKCTGASKYRIFYF